MKCIECDKCRKGWFKSKPAEYVCIGVREPFVIEDVGQECTEYPEKSDVATVHVDVVEPDEMYYVDDIGIHRKVYYHHPVYECVMTKEMFIDAYNKWIKGGANESN